MGDNVPDPCECVEAWNHEFVMRRLINLLRQGQTDCTDINCVDEGPSLPESASDTNLWLGVFMLTFAFIWFAMRPRQNRIMDVAKPTPNFEDRDGAPPTPPRT